MAKGNNVSKNDVKLDFDFKRIKKLKENEKYFEKVEDVICSGEELLSAYSSGRDGVVFTSKRIILINVKGATGKKKSFTSIPYNKISVYEIETAGAFDRDAELAVFLSGIGRVQFEFKGRCNVKEISARIAEYMD